MVKLIKKGYDQKTNEERWTFPAALMFTLRSEQNYFSFYFKSALPSILPATIFLPAKAL